MSLSFFLKKERSLRTGDIYTSFADDSCLEVVYRMYWLCYHIHTYKKTTVMLLYMIAQDHCSSLWSYNVLKVYGPMFV